MKVIKLFLLFFSANLLSQDYNLEWANPLNGNSDVIISEHVVDSNENIYITGYFIGSVDFDPSANDYILTSPSSTYNNNNDIFIAKYSNDGTLIWAKQLIGTGVADFGLSIDIDTNNNLYMTGYFSQNVDFNPSPSASYNIIVNGSPHAYLLKLDYNGNFIWAKHIVSSASSIGRSVKYYNNHIYLVGSFYGNSDFDFSSNNFILSSNSTQTDGFLAKYSLNGDFIWAKKYGGTTVGETLWGINFDSDNNIYLNGYIRGYGTGSTLIDGTTSVQYFGSDDILILKTNDFGNLIWAKSYGSFNNDYSYGNIIVDNNNSNIYVNGKYSNSVDFNDDPSDTFYLSSGSNCGFILKLNFNGIFQDAIRIGPNGTSTPCLKGFLSQNQIIFCGKFSNTVDFDNSTNNYSLTSSGQEDIYILNLDLNLNFLNAKKISGNGNEIFGGVSLKNEKLYITGAYNGETNFDLLGGSSTLNPLSSYDSFISKYSLTLLTNTSFNLSERKIYPNPFSSIINIDAFDLEKVEIYDSSGKLKLIKRILNEKNIELDLSHLINNTYYIKLINSENSVKYFKIIKE
ncbi:T9SS type A sorting domain-containing protein [Flavobacterium okayamense]|uniref:Secretion system C-terminal sorting domain-containing protein n=1 Tax=Flavobacterium okayamense TaxID=2830782 RepID=A0ABM7S404_9FLAO|nr:T9SS type A sorting domain-containing protein [Flavobacterium okayamense]BCY28227.1 hypothetical protein KK2020170_10950 [Flavobacterium okayamense]